MSALQLQILLRYMFSPLLRDVYFRFQPIDSELRLHIWYTDSAGKYHYSFGPAGDLVDHKD